MKSRLEVCSNAAATQRKDIDKNGGDSRLVCSGLIHHLVSAPFKNG